MNSKTKFFNKGLIKADLKRFWIFSLLYAALIFFVAFFGFYINTYYSGGNSAEYIYTRFFGLSEIANFFGVLFGAFLSPVLFYFLNSSSAVSFYHGLPQGRGKIFASKAVSAALLLSLPVIINAAIVILSKVCGSAMPVRISHILIWACLQLLYSFLAFACMTFTATITGNIFSHIIISGICFAAPALLLFYLDELCSRYLLGYAGNMTTMLQYIYILPDKILSPLALIYIAATVILFFASALIYKKRLLERSGEALVFKGAKICLIYAGAILGGIISYWYFSIWFDKSIFFMLPFGIIAVIIANMVNKRGITLRGAFGHIGIFALFVLVLFAGFKYDITGFEKRIPGAENIESVKITSGNPYIIDNDAFTSYDENGRAEKYKSAPDFAITDREDIKSVCNYHRFKAEEAKRDNSSGSIRIEYTLKNGKRLTRSYSFEKNADKEYFKPIAATDTLKRQRYLLYQNSFANITSVEICSSPLTAEPSDTIYPENDCFNELCIALDNDIKNLAYDEDASLCTSSFAVPITLYINFTGKNNKAIWPNRTSYPITDGFTETTEVLQKYGLISQKFAAENVDSIMILHLDPEKGYESEATEVINDTGKIADIMEQIKYSYKNKPSDRGRITEYRFRLKDNEEYSISIDE